MISVDDVRGVIGRQVVGSDGQKIGKAGQVFLDDRSGEPEWVTVSTGLFGSRETFVPLRDADVRGDEVAVAYTKDVVKDAPNVDVDAGHLDESQEAELYRYYSLDYDTTGYDTTTTTTTDTRAAGAVGRDTSGPVTDDAMTRSEERVRVGTERVAAGQARLRKWVETEEVQVPVTVSRERATLVSEPITDANRDAALSGGDITSEEHEVTLTEERAVVAKETVPVERVRLDTETVQEETVVSEEVRKERIAAEGDIADGTAGVTDRR